MCLYSSWPLEQPLPSALPCALQLKADDVALRLGSIRRLSTSALALGEEHTRKDLIPCLNASSGDHDQVLLAMADELGKFVPYVGGPAHAHTLLVPLETLCCTEETVVREKAVDSLALVGAELPESSVEEYYFPLVQVGSVLQRRRQLASACIR